MSAELAFASKLRWWRQHRGCSQLDLAGRAEISQRHLSFLELGRASPSREMVLRLAAALDLPFREQNALGAPELSQISSALDFMLAQQEPFPAVAVDRRWTLLRGNAGASRLVEFLVGPVAPGAAVNLADALVAPDVLRPYLANWSEVVRYFIRSVEADAAADGTAATAALLDRLMGYDGVRSALREPASGDPSGGPVLPMHFRKGDVSLRLFTTIATLGTPRDITLQELRVESFFPMDAATERVLRAWAPEAGQRGLRAPA